MTDIYIISGFLGAGKTTLIQKLLSEAFQGKKVALVENDFGEVSVDAALLKGGGYQVRELSAGCICCSLTGDFIAALSSLLKSCRPQVVLIEPSGVGKLSDVEKACKSRVLLPSARIAGKITVVDVKRCGRYLENFGEFFEDQVSNADTLLFSRVEQFPEQIPSALELVTPLNPGAAVFAKAWAAVPSAALLANYAPAPQAETLPEEPLPPFGGAAPHVSWQRRHGGAQVRQLKGSPVRGAFDTLTLRFHHPVSLPDVAARLAALEKPEYGSVLRAKGILQSPEGFINLQFLPGDLKIERTDVSGNELCIIGKELDAEKISAAFRGI